ncbi:hypothetical protein chiPu_0016021 [Chiloscyllium punctatum]|uniref:Uncharacterized protein n=1 Tax=Chiloscyllium punctatum TaxID=137246 RepID=A0A401T4H2_CHIPU|nr:hypothetical protein [Chiloscyllium punctatum]
MKTKHLLTTMFRNSIIEAMPTSQSRLEDVLSLTSSLSHQEFRDHVAYAVERFRKDKEKLCKQQEEVQRKLAQMQLEDLKKKDKGKAEKVLPLRTGTASQSQDHHSVAGPAAFELGAKSVEERDSLMRPVAKGFCPHRYGFRMDILSSECDSE